MGSLKVWIALVERMPGPIVRKTDNLVGWLCDAPDLGPDGHAIVVGCRAIFIDIVAQMQHGIDALKLGNGLIGVEKTCRIERAAGHGQHHILDRADGQGPPTAHWRGHALADEAVVIVRAWLKAANIDLDRMVTGRIGHRLALRNDRLEARIGGQFPAHHRLSLCRRADPRPNDQTIRQRITAGDAVGEGHLGLTRRG